MEKYKYFLHDLTVLLKEKLEQAKERQTSTDSLFEEGLSMGFYEALDLIRSQAKAFDIPLEEIGLNDYNLEL